MSISKEERDQWRERLLSPYTCFNADHADFTIRLLDALEEADRERLEWTDEPPKVPGWYWFKDEYGIRIAWIKHDSRKMDELYAVIGGVGNWMSTLHGQWAGPIPEPREPKE